LIDFDWNMILLAWGTFVIGFGAGGALYWYTDERRREE
jgi:hypothetical protein